ncbi:MAG: S8 family serine peptidase [Gammaproteobacteria bacterium]
MTSASFFRHALFAAIAALALARCGGDGTGPGGSQPRPAALAFVSGSNQAGTVAEPLGQPLVVRVTSDAGAGASGVVVSWALTGGGGSLSASTSTTDANGRASVTWTLGTVAGTNNNTATASVTGLAGSPVTFTASATPGPPSQLVIASGNGQVGAVGQSLPQPLVVAVRDQYANGVKDVAVTWTVTSGGGDVSSTSVATDATGNASIMWTLGTAAGTEKDTVAASVSGLTGSPATFTASSTPGPAAQLVEISGDGQSAQVAQAVPQPLVVAVRDQYGNAVSGAPVEWGAVTGGGSVSASQVSSGTDGRSSVTWTLGTIAGSHTSRATLPDVSGSPVTFIATATPGPASQLTIAGGNDQTAPAATTLPLPLSASVTDAYGNGVPDIEVTWSLLSGDGTLSTAASQTGSDGGAATQWTLGRFAGTQTASASAGTLQGSPLTFTATATPNATVSGVVTLANAFLVARPSRKATVADASAVRPMGGGKAGGSPRAFAGRPMLASAVARPRVPEYRRDEVIVTFRASSLRAPPIGSRALAATGTARAVGGTIRARLEASGARSRFEIAGVSPVILAARIRVSHPAQLDDVAAHIRRDPAVASVERNPVVRLERSPAGPGTLSTSANDPLYPWQAWHYGMIDLPEAWGITTGSPGVLVAVVDDGIRFDHPAIAANLTTDGYDFVSNVAVDHCTLGPIGNGGDGDGYDPDPTQPASYDRDPVLGCLSALSSSGNHGLHVAGTVGAVGNDGVGVTGVSWSVRIRPVRVLGVGGSGTNYDIAQGILYAAGLPADDGAGGTVQPTAGAKIVNLSVAGPTPSLDLENAVIAATNAGALLIAAAANDATADPRYPAAYPQAMSVSAVGPDGVLASYSSYGSTVDITAPGGDILDGDATFGIMSTAWNFATNTPIYDASVWNGTSMAAPHVSGVAALLLAQSPGLTNSDLRSRLVSYAVDIGAPGLDDLYGAGLVNARNSLTQSFAPPRALYVRLFDAVTGAVVRTLAAAPDGSYAFTALDDGGYRAFAGQDQNGDQQIGVPGRGWGAYGGSATPTTIAVAGAGTYPASFSIGLPAELEPNGSFGAADELPVGGYLYGTIAAPLGSGTPDGDVSLVRVPIGGQYTFETSAWDGACAFGLEEDTYLELYDAGGTLITTNDDIAAGADNYCSRITASLSAGTYHVVVWGYLGTRYRVQARSGP